MWRQRYLVPQRQYIPYLDYPLNLSLHCILSCFQGDNCSPYYRIFSMIIRSPYKYPRTWAPRPCWHYYFYCYSFASYFFFCVLCLFRLRIWGFTVSILLLSLSFDLVAIRTLGTLPRTWASLRGTHWTELHNSFKV